MFRLAQKEHLIVPAHVDHLANLRDFVVQIGEKYRFSHKLVNAFKLAVDEAATNIIEHAYGDNEGYITIQAIIRRKSLTINLIDQGIYFDPKWVKSPDIKNNLDENLPTGLGIFMMRRLMDKVDYCKTEAGNELSLTKIDSGRGKRLSFASLADLPASLKMRYVANAAFLLAIVHLLGFAYFYSRVADKIAAPYFQSGKKLSKRLSKQLGSVRPELLGGPDGSDYIDAIMLPVSDENMGRIYSLSLEDTLGNVAWSTIYSEIGQPFERPASPILTTSGALSYVVDGTTEIFEFQHPLTAHDRALAFKSVHVLLLGSYLESEIQAKVHYYVKLALLSFGLSYGILLLMIYVVTYPLRKLSRWVRDVREGEVRNDLDIDSTSEIGEIARAFSDITEKYRESQKHLATREKFEKEIYLAQEVQRALLPEKTPVLESLEIDAYYEPAETVSGDFYDFIEIDQDAVGIVVADVAGKGVPGSMVMTMIRTALRTEARGQRDAAEVLRRVNEFVFNDMAKGLFVTVFYVIIDTKVLTLNFASAGHTPMILHRGRSKSSFYINPVGFPIGLKLPEPDSFNIRIESDTIQLEEGDTVLLYTDGLTEAMNRKRALFGEERLLTAIRQHHADPLLAFVENLKNAVYSFREGTPQHDDITLVAIRRKSVKTDKSSRTDASPVDDSISVEAKFLSIEEVTRILDVVAAQPEYEAEEIQRKLKTKRYQNTEIDIARIEAELRRRGLHTPGLRLLFAQTCESSDREVRPPGTPRLNLTGSVRMARRKRPKRKLKVAPDGGIKAKPPAEQPTPDPADTRSAFLPLAAKPVYRQETPKSSEIAPEDEAEFVFGDFIDDLITVTARPGPAVEEQEKTPVVEDKTEEAPLQAGESPKLKEDPPDENPESVHPVAEKPTALAETENAAELEVGSASPVMEDGHEVLEISAETESENKESPELEVEEPVTDPTSAVQDDISDSLVDSIFHGYLAQPEPDGAPPREQPDSTGTITERQWTDGAPETSDLAEPPEAADEDDEYASLLPSPDETLGKATGPDEVPVEESADMAGESEIIEQTQPLAQTEQVEEPLSGPSQESDPAPTHSTEEELPAPADTVPEAVDMGQDAFGPAEDVDAPEAAAPPEVFPITELKANELDDQYFQRPRKPKSKKQQAPASESDVRESGATLANALLATASNLSEQPPAVPDEAPPLEETTDLHENRDTITSDDAYFSATVESLLAPQDEATTFEDSRTEDIEPPPEKTPTPTKDHEQTAARQFSERELEAGEAPVPERSEETAEPDGEDEAIESVFRTIELDAIVGHAPDDADDQTEPATPGDEMPGADIEVPPMWETASDRDETTLPPEIPESTAAEDTGSTTATESGDAAQPEAAEESELQQLLQLGIQRYREKDYEHAIIYFKKVLKIDPNFHDVYAMLSNSYFRNDMLGEAVVCYEQLKEDGAADISSRENLALIYWKLGVQKLAVTEWQEILRENPERKDIEARIARALSKTRPVSDEAAATESSLHVEQPCNGHNGNSDHIQFLQQGIECYRTKDYESAIAIFKRVIEQFPEQKEGYNYLGNAYFRKGMLDEAAEIYERLEEMEFENTAVLENLGLIRAKQGRYAAAAAKWSKALQRNPDRLDLKRKIDKIKELI